MFIYKITNKINQKSYIGYNSADRDTRWRDHKREYIKESQSSKLLYRAMNKYGIDNFSYERIEDDITDIDTLKCREIYWIESCKSFGELGYNMTMGGDGGCGNRTFLESATSEELALYSKKISDSKKDFFSDNKKKVEWSQRSIKLNTAQHMINGRTRGRKKWWNSLTDEERFSIQSAKSTNWWEKLTPDEQIELSNVKSKNALAYRNSLTHQQKQERIDNQRNKVSKTYKLVSPVGQIIITNRLREKSKELGVSYNTFLTAVKEKRQVKGGWICEIIEGKQYGNS